MSLNLGLNDQQLAVPSPTIKQWRQCRKLDQHVDLMFSSSSGPSRILSSFMNASLALQQAIMTHDRVFDALLLKTKVGLEVGVV